MSGKVLDIIIKLSWFGRIVKFIDSIAIGSCEEVSKIGCGISWIECSILTCFCTMIILLAKSCVVMSLTRWNVL